MRSSTALLRSLIRTTAPRGCTPFAQDCTPVSKRLYHAPRPTILHRPQICASLRQTFPRSVRYESTGSASSNAPSAPSVTSEHRLERDQVPSYELTFTCKKCSTRSSHRVSKQGYHHGTVLIACPGCKNRHLISDHMKIFSDNAITIEDLMREKGQLVKRGSLSAEGDVEFWDDGSTTPRSATPIHPSGENTGEGRLTEPAKSENTAQTSESSLDPRS